MKKIYVKIEGIHCSRCPVVIRKELLKNKKIKEVEIKRNIAHISYNGKLTKKEIINAINELDYFTKEEYITENLKEIDIKIELREFILIITMIISIWFLINKIFNYSIFNVIPNIDSSTTYSMLFTVGLLTSIHCASMCGAINLIATYNKNYKNILLYNLGRVIGYTLIGGLAGALGSVVSFNKTFSGIIIIFASILMVLMSLNMLGIIDFKLPFNYRPKIIKNSFVIGLLNSLMPCGPLQSMQIYALSTGSFIKGALSMFLFSLGTVPLMLSISLFYKLFKGKKKIFINKVASILILVLSLSMLNRGLLSLGIDINQNSNNYEETEVKENIQIIEFNLDYNNYKDIVVKKDIPVKMIIHADKKHLTGCNNEIISKDFNIDEKLKVGKNIIEFTPKKTGTYTYTCYMNMIKNTIKVVDRTR